MFKYFLTLVVWRGNNQEYRFRVRFFCTVGFYDVPWHPLHTPEILFEYSTSTCYEWWVLGPLLYRYGENELVTHADLFAISQTGTTSTVRTILMLRVCQDTLLRCMMEIWNIKCASNFCWVFCDLVPFGGA